MLGYGDSPKASASYGIDEEVRHLEAWLDARGVDAFHLAAHSLGAMVGLHLRLRLGARVTQLSLIDPLVVSVLRDGEDEALAEMAQAYRAVMDRTLDDATMARLFVDHWNGPGAFEGIGERARAVIVSLMPKVRAEIEANETDRTSAARFAEGAPRTTMLVGEMTRVAPAATARALARAFGTNVCVLPGAGHMIPLSHPQELAAWLREVHHP
jgi:pimeloyl-ACP methyl ester carboxylesterase